MGIHDGSGTSDDYDRVRDAVNEGQFAFADGHREVNDALCMTPDAVFGVIRGEALYGLRDLLPDSLKSARVVCTDVGDQIEHWVIRRIPGPDHLSPDIPVSSVLETNAAAFSSILTEAFAGIDPETGKETGPEIYDMQTGKRVPTNIVRRLRDNHRVADIAEMAKPLPALIIEKTQPAGTEEAAPVAKRRRRGRTSA